MNAPKRRSRLTAMDREQITAAADEIDRIAMREGRNAVRRIVQGELIDVAARLRTVLIWALPTP